MFARALSVAAAVIAACLAAPLAPSASAHCEPGTEGHLLGGLPSTCPYNDAPENVIDALNEASNRTTVYVLVKDFTFHPEIVTVANNGTVVFVYADIEHVHPHDPRSSGSTGDAAADLLRPVPNNPGKCFTVTIDQAGDMESLGHTYPLTFRYDAESGAVYKSHGMASGSLLGDLSGAEAWKRCPDGTVSYDPEADLAVLAYHCGLHGGAGTSPDIMRGAIRILP